MKRSGFMRHGELEQDFELNIASIIDCFVVLIAFILISTSFFSIGILDAEVSGGGADASVAKAEETAVIELKADHSILVKYGTGRNASTRISSRKGEWDLEKMTGVLEALKGKVKGLDSAVLMAENAVTYRDVMASMEAAKTQIAKVNLGGF